MDLTVRKVVYFTNFLREPGDEGAVPDCPEVVIPLLRGNNTRWKTWPDDIKGIAFEKNQ